MGVFIKQKDVEDRVSEVALERITDDDNDGDADGDSVRRMIEDAEADLFGVLDTQYSLDAVVAAMKVASPSDAIKRSRALLKSIALDLVEGRLYVRHPEYGRQDGADIIARGDKRLDMLSKSRMTLPGIAPAAANVGADTTADDPDLDPNPPRTWGSGTGLF